MQSAPARQLKQVSSHLATMAAGGNAHLPLRLGEKQRIPTGLCSICFLKSDNEEHLEMTRMESNEAGEKDQSGRSFNRATVEPESTPLLRKCFSQNLRSQGHPHLNLFLSGHSQSSVNEAPATTSAIAFTTKVIFPLCLHRSLPTSLSYIHRYL